MVPHVENSDLVTDLTKCTRLGPSVTQCDLDNAKISSSVCSMGL